MPKQISRRILDGHRNAAAFAGSTKVRIFWCDRHKSDRRGGIMLGFSPRLERTIGFILVVKRFSHQINTDEVFGTHSRARRAQN
jgi:hypothetical protein